MTPEGEGLLRAGGEALGLDLEAALPQFGRLHDLLVAASAQQNLTALKDERDIVLKHFVDSLTCLTTGLFDGDEQVLDLGTGAGFPALPLAIARPRLSISPLDATRRKVEFVAETARSLGLENVHPLVGRAETVGRDPQHRGRYDRVVTRAVASLAVLVEVSLPLLREGGVLVAQKGPGANEELVAARGALDKVGGIVHDVRALDLPVSGEERHLVLIEKVRETPAAYPRREGVPGKHPLS